jgi:hypothetical protein
MTIILTILITLLALQLLPAPACARISANRRSTVTILAAAAVVTALLAITTAGGGDAPTTPRLLQQAAQAAAARGGGYDYTCQPYGRTPPDRLPRRTRERQLPGLTHRAAATRTRNRPMTPRRATIGQPAEP